LLPSASHKPAYSPDAKPLACRSPPARGHPGQRALGWVGMSWGACRAAAGAAAADGSCASKKSAARRRSHPSQPPWPDGRRGRRYQPQPGGHRQRQPRLPARRGDLGTGHPGPVAGGVRFADRRRHPAAAGRHRGRQRHLAAGHPQQVAAGQRDHLLGGPAGRDGRRRGLLAVLLAPRTGGTRRRALCSPGAEDRFGDLRTGHRHLRADCDDLPGRAVPVRHRRLRRPGDRHDPGGRPGGSRVGDRPAGPAGLAGPPRRPGPDPAARPPTHRRPPLPAVGSASCPPASRSSAP
jgi:hypothetical protein